MIDRTKVLQVFGQVANSCVLATYGLAIGARLQQRVSVFFMGYCQHYQVQHAQGYEFDYASDFNSRWYKEQRTGFQIIQELHESSGFSPFPDARSVAAVAFYPDTLGNAAFLEQTLRGEPALLCIAEDGGVHAVVVGCDDQGFYRVDPRNAPFPQVIDPPLSANGINNPQDGLLVKFLPEN